MTSAVAATSPQSSPGSPRSTRRSPSRPAPRGGHAAQGEQGAVVQQLGRAEGDAGAEGHASAQGKPARCTPAAPARPGLSLRVAGHPGGAERAGGGPRAGRAEPRGGVCELGAERAGRWLLARRCVHVGQRRSIMGGLLLAAVRDGSVLTLTASWRSPLRPWISVITVPRRALRAPVPGYPRPLLLGMSFRD